MKTGLDSEKPTKIYCRRTRCKNCKWNGLPKFEVVWNGGRYSIRRIYIWKGVLPSVSGSSTACDWSTGRKRSHSNSNQLKISNITVVTSLWNPRFYISCKARSSSLYHRTKMLMKKIRHRTKNRRKQSCRTCQMPHHASPYCEALLCDPLFPLVSPQL